MSTGSDVTTNYTYFLREICDYRANYMGCDPSLTQYFATIDLVIILLTVLSIIGFCGKIIHNVLTKVVKESDGKKKWNAIDTTCLLCCLSNVFRIVQLANVRSVASKDKTQLTDANVAQYVQFNVIMDFIYYGTGVLSATSSVVGAAAGVNLYSDIKIGNTVVSPSKFFRVFRVVVLVLTLSFDICWATLGTSAGVQSYTMYRRACYIVSMFSIAFVTLPMMVYFSGKVLVVLKQAKVVERDASQNQKDNTKVTSEANASRIKANESQKAIDIKSLDKKSLISHGQSVPEDKRKTLVLANKPKVNPHEAKIASFRFAINTVIWFLYVTTFCNLALLILGFELPYFQESLAGIIVLKTISDLSVWVSCGFMLLYLYLC
ncbi:hypothetical protein HDV06_005359 [Boothiomyces sp. JEL0866]|nr:hypothetical protein HDV06_005359 [Boothiomyces sp. JEL0866]